MAHTADAHIVVGKPLPADHLEEVEDLLALPPHIEQRGERGPHLVHHKAHRQQVVADAHELSHDHAQVFCSLGDGDLRQLLHRDDIGHVVGHRGDVVQPVGEGDVLGIGAAFCQLLYAAVQVSEDGLKVNDHLAVQGDPHAEHPVGGGVLRPHVDDEGLSLQYHFLPFFDLLLIFPWC